MTLPLILLALFVSSCAFISAITLVYQIRDKRQGALLLQLNRLNETLEEELKQQNESILQLRKDCRLLYREQFSEIKYCLEQAIVLKDTESTRQRYLQRLEQQLAFFSSQERKDERETFINQRTGGVLALLRKDFPTMRETDFQILAYIVLGFDAALICMITGLTASNYYTRKSRLKEKILGSNSPNIGLYEQWIF